MIAAAPRPGGIATPDGCLSRQLFPSVLGDDADGAIVTDEAAALEIAFDRALGSLAAAAATKVQTFIAANARRPAD